MGTITITDLGKAYKQYPTRWSRLREWLVPYSKPRHQLTWVLQNINFTVNPGEAVGIIGINGAGKSTLLKMITGTTQPTTGSIVITGRVAALLELGMGFHPDFTGRQNVYMAGQLLGMTVSEITGLMPEIEAFAEIGDYIDQPVRVYSSGMQMRVAFSVATTRRPDVLIVDEALSVGDAYFQHKSFDRIREFRKQGTTLLIVSHDKSAIQSICDRAILLNAGKLAMQGKPEAVMDYYNAMLAQKENSKIEQTPSISGKLQTISGTGEARIKFCKLLDTETADEIIVAKVGQSLELRLEASIHADLPQLVLGYRITDKHGNIVWGSNTWHTRQIQMNAKAGEIIVFRLPFTCTLGEGSYSVSAALHSTSGHLKDNYEWVDNMLVFDVINVDRDIFIGSSWLDAQFIIFRES
jgi:lipopolysaccharide transport system ATP-binding protein